jgi:hypothetical protein
MKDSVENGRPISAAIGRRRWWSSLLLGTGILFFGVIIGAGGMFLWKKSRRRFRRASHTDGARHIAERMRSNLDLTDEQTEKVRVILEKHLKAFQAIQQEIAPKLEAQRGKIQEELKEVLAPEQFEKWKKRFESMKKRFRHGRPRRRRRGP